MANVMSADAAHNTTNVTDSGIVSNESPHNTQTPPISDERHEEKKKVREIWISSTIGVGVVILSVVSALISNFPGVHPLLKICGEYEWVAVIVAYLIFITLSLVLTSMIKAKRLNLFFASEHVKESNELVNQIKTAQEKQSELHDGNCKALALASEQLNHSLNLLSGMSTNLENKLSLCNEIKEHIDNCDRACFSTVEGRTAYERYLSAAKTRAAQRTDRNTKIYLTSFAPTPEVAGHGGNIDDFFAEEVEYCTKNRNVEIRRIVAIHTDRKFHAYKKFVENAVVAECHNLFIAYLHVGTFEAAPLPGVIGIQVIDDDEIILMDPRFAFLNEGEGSDPIHIKDESIASLFIEYHKNLWRKIRDSHVTNQKLGCILYDGDTCDSVDQVTWEQIKKQMNSVTETITPPTVI